MKNRILVPALLLMTLPVSFSCKKKLTPGTYVSMPTKMGNGELTAWVNFDKDANPTAIGMTLTEGALEGLSEDTSLHAGNHHENIFEAQLPPELVSKTPFRHVAVNWNPAGHTPGIYTKPHFDFHFYMTTSDERKKIPTYSEDPTGFDNLPAPEYLPADYINPGGGEPEMGAHWIDKNSPELTDPSKWEQTFVYGSYDGKVNFYEPMVTYVYLKNTAEVKKSIPWPAKVKVSGYYPKSFRLKKEDGVYKVIIEDFEFRKGS